MSTKNPSIEELIAIIDSCKNIRSVRREIKTKHPEFFLFLEQQSVLKKESLDQILFDIVYPDKIKMCTKTNNKVGFGRLSTGYYYCGPKTICECSQKSFKDKFDQTIKLKQSEAKENNTTYSNPTVYNTLDKTVIMEGLKNSTITELSSKMGIARTTLVKSMKYYKISEPERTTKLEDILKNPLLCNKQYVIDKLSTMNRTSLADELLTTKYYIDLAANYHNITQDDVVHQRRINSVECVELRDIEYIKKRLEDNNTIELACEFGVEYDEMHRIIRDVHQIKDRRSYHKPRFATKELSDASWVKNELATKSVKLIAKNLNTTAYKVRSAIYQHDIDLSLYSTGTSIGELELLDEIKLIYTGEVVHRSRAIISPHELDIYLPDLKLAIEYNGDYWHSSEHKDKFYHQMKTSKCKDLGIDLVHVYESQWDDKDLVLNHLKNLINFKITKDPLYIEGFINSEEVIIDDDLGLDTLFESSGYIKQNTSDPELINTILWDCYNSGYTTWKLK